MPSKHHRAEKTFKVATDDGTIARRIAAAVILQAQKDIHSAYPSGVAAGTEAASRDEARAWTRRTVAGWNAETGCTFVGCCEILRLDVAATRERVLGHRASRVREMAEEMEVAE